MSEKPREPSALVYVGIYTGEKGRGIYAFRLMGDTGTLEPMGLAAESRNPSFLAIDTNRNLLFAANEIDDYMGPDGRKGGAVTSFHIDRDSGKLTKLNQVSSGGTAPCFVSLSSRRSHLLVANYGSGSVSAIPVNSDGSLSGARCTVQHEGASVHPGRQSAPHAHSIAPTPDGQFVLAADLGVDRILCYKLQDDTGELVSASPAAIAAPPGSGPRHFAFHPNGNTLYVSSELSNRLLVYELLSGQAIQRQNLSLLPADFDGETKAAEVLVHPDGRFLYASNRGHDSIAIFELNTQTGAAKLVRHVSTRGNSPRGFGIDPTGEWLIAANQESDNLVVFRIDETTGALEPAGDPVTIGCPVCVRFI